MLGNRINDEEVSRLSPSRKTGNPCAGPQKSRPALLCPNALHLRYIPEVFATERSTLPRHVDAPEQGGANLVQLIPAPMKGCES